MILRVLLLMVCLSVSSCALVDVRQTTTYDRDFQPMTESTVDNIVPGKTTKTWLIENLGQPEAVSSNKNGSEIFTYRVVEKKLERVRIFILFKYETMNETDKHIFVHLADGLVVKYWRDYALPSIAEDSYEQQPQDYTLELSSEGKVIFSPKAQLTEEEQPQTTSESQPAPVVNQQDECYLTCWFKKIVLH